MRFFIFCVVSVLVCSCATLTPKTNEEKVAERADDFIQLLVSKDLESARNYTTPAYRKGVAPGRFKSKFLGAANWTKAGVKSVICESDYCKVAYSVDYYNPMVRDHLSTELNYRWIQVDGQWWIYIK